MVNCSHKAPQWSISDCNEDGWSCGDCGAAFGFRPDLDREHTREKVGAILFWLHENSFLYVSNASEGDSVTAEVARLCRAADEYDQQTIVYLLAATGRERHAAFWREKAKKAACSHPSRGVDGDALKCHACGHEKKINTDSGELFSRITND
jgi:hypothetical protein